METAETPISKILINNSTKMSLNERFTTVMQAAGPKITARKLGRRPLQRASQSGAIIRKFSTANRKFLDELAKKHKIMAALKIKKRNLKATMPARGRNRNRAAMKKVLRVGPNGQLTRANSLSKIATLKSDYVKPAVRRSNSTSNIAARLGARRSAGNAEPRRRLNRNNVVRRSNSKTNLTRSNSTASLRRSTSRQSLRRSNSRVNINRSNSRNRNSAPPINNRIARRNSISSRRGRGGGGGGGGVAQGRIFKRRNSTGSANAVNNSAWQGRVSRTRGRGNSTMRRGRSASANRGSNVVVQRGAGRGGIVGRGGRGRGRGRGGAAGDIRRGGGNRGRGGGGIGGRGRGRSRGRGTTRGTGRRTEIKKEDLDKELDQYMANTKGPADTDVLMNNSSI